VPGGLEGISRILGDQALDLGDDFVVDSGPGSVHAVHDGDAGGEANASQGRGDLVVSTSLRISVAAVDPLMTTPMVFFVVE
jgi:hypothetical protein